QNRAMQQGWCRACGGGLVDGRCENCETAPMRRAEGKRRFAADNAVVREWVERRVPLFPDEDPIEALLMALVNRPSGGSRTELSIDTSTLTIRGLRDGVVGWTLEMPRVVALRIVVYLETLAVRSIESVEREPPALAFERQGMRCRVWLSRL